MKEIKIGLIGAGTVGSGVVNLIRKNSGIISNKTGIKISIKKVADTNQEVKNKLKLDDKIFTTNAEEIIKDKEIDIIVELIGGINPAKKYIIEGMKEGKHIVTANKALLSQYWEEIFSLANKYNKLIGFEASVAGGVPIIKSIRESLIGNRILKIYGILNGTTNFILTKMEEEGYEFKQALEIAQKLGFAEKDPTYDIEGIDSAHKLQILSSLAFNSNIDFKKIYYEGISNIDLTDILYVNNLGYKIKLLAIAKIDKEEGVCECRVHPTIIPIANPLSSVRKEYNGILVEGDAVGVQIYYGKGAGSLPTASAIVSDIVDISNKILTNQSLNTYQLYKKNNELKIKEIKNIKCRYYLRFKTVDKPGVLAKISNILGQNNISISSVLQKETGQKVVPIVMLTHLALENDIINSLKLIDKLDVVKEKSKFIRIEDGI
jgi:homoserine dehydrogenase